MDWPRVKTLLIVILLIVDVILGGVWLSRVHNERAQERKAERELCDLLAQKNILASPEQIGDERAYSYHWERSRQQEALVATLLLGSAEEQHVGDTVTYYENERGHAEFRMNGEITLTAAEMPPDALELMRRMGFDSARGNATEGYVQLLEGLPIFRNVTRLIPGGELRITGRWFWGEALPVNANECYSAAYCLLGLAESLQSADALQLENCELGFRETQIETDIILLTPYWRVTLSSGVYYVNAVTGRAEL